MTIIDTPQHDKFVTREKEEDEHGEECPICSDDITDRKALQCGHVFCTACIDQWFSNRPTCPMCGTVYAVVRGNQPEGEMTTRSYPKDLPGFPRDSGTIEITYNFPSGRQKVKIITVIYD